MSNARTKRFIERAIECHGAQYDYSLVELPKGVKHPKVVIICSIHGAFEQLPSDHLRKQRNRDGYMGCRKCGNDERYIGHATLTRNRCQYCGAVRRKGDKWRNGKICNDAGCLSKYEMRDGTRIKNLSPWGQAARRLSAACRKKTYDGWELWARRKNKIRQSPTHNSVRTRKAVNWTESAIQIAETLRRKAFVNSSPWQKWARRKRSSMRQVGQRLQNRSGHVTASDILTVLKYQEYRCALTGVPLTPKTATVDHIVPIKHGGEHSPSNIQIVTPEANRIKGSMTMEELLAMCKMIVSTLEEGL